MRDILTKSLNIRGFIQREFADQKPEFLEEMAAWIRAGRVRYREDIINGLENAPSGLIGLLQGRNFGKILVRVSAL
jgi:NADPH-dependent curcumin reductase CurA